MSFKIIIYSYRGCFLSLNLRRDFPELIFDSTDTNILKVLCSFIAFRVAEFETVFRVLMFWRFFFLPPISPNKIQYYTVVPTKNDSDVILCLQLLSKTLTCTLHLS